jgi:hypothetical protein
MMKRVIAQSSKSIRGAVNTHKPGSAAHLLAAEIGMVVDDISIIGNGHYVLINGANFVCPAARVGMAEKKQTKGGNRRFTKRQLTFLGWCYRRGVANKANKMSPKQAEDAMVLHGTVAGAKRYPGDKFWQLENDDDEPLKPFGIGELLEHWTFRSWFGQQNKAFEGKLQKSMDKAANGFEALVADRAAAGHSAAGECDEEDDGEE